MFNQLQRGVAYLYPLKTSENLKVFCLSIPPGNIRKPKSFLMIPGGIDKQHRAVRSETNKDWTF